MDKKCTGCVFNLDGVCHYDSDKGCYLDYLKYDQNTKRYYKWVDGHWVLWEE